MRLLLLTVTLKFKHILALHQGSLSTSHSTETKVWLIVASDLRDPDLMFCYAFLGLLPLFRGEVLDQLNALTPLSEAETFKQGLRMSPLPIDGKGNAA